MMQHYRSHRNRSYRQNEATYSSPYSTYYPGVQPYNSSDSLKVESSALTPYSPSYSQSLSQPFSDSSSSTSLLPASSASSATKAGGGFSLPSMGDLKGMIDRLGGIDGILNTVGKVQKVMQTVQQFAPMAKLLTGLLPGAKPAKLQGGSGGNLDEYTPPRRRSGKSKRRKPSGTRKKSGARNSKTGKRRR